MSENSDSFRVAVIGAGASGLAALKCCLDEGIIPTCFEKSDGVGGLWRYTENPEQGRAGVYRSTTINTSKELLAYSTFPPPEDFPNFMHHSKLYEYLRLYAEEYKLYDFIKFNSEVVSVSKSSDFESDRKWLVTWKCEGQKSAKLFDAVMVCSGHHAYPNNPASKIPGFKEFKGRVSHGHEYRDHKPFENRHVMIVGLGNTGGDLAAELSRHCNKVYLSSRRGAWVINRIAEKGLPYDCTLVTRIFSYLTDITPASILNWVYEKKMSDRFDHELYGLKPRHSILSQHPLVNDELPARIANGTVTIVPDIAKFKEEGVETTDGAFHQVNDVIFATGYNIKFPFVSNDVIDVDENNNLPPLYKHIFPISLGEKPTMALIGNVQPLGGLMPIAEMQSRWAARVFTGSAKLPSTANMQREVVTRNKNLRIRYVKSKRHTIQVDYLFYMDQIAREIGVQPNLAKLFITDPTLGWKVLMGPASSYQFRIHGPGAWDGAKLAITDQWQRIECGYGRKASLLRQNSIIRAPACVTKDSKSHLDSDPINKVLSSIKTSLEPNVISMFSAILMMAIATFIIGIPLT